MAGGLFQRLKNWKAWETVLNADLNAEFNNVISNLKAALLTGHSFNVAEMQESTSPGALGTESLSSSLADELKRIRYQLDAIIGQTHWYQAPTASIEDLNTSIQGLQTIPRSRILSGRKDANNQPMFLVPNGAALTIVLNCATTNLATYINGTARTFSANLTVSTLQAAPSSNNTCLVNNVALTAQLYTKTLGERGTQIPIDNVGSEITSLNGKYAAFNKGSEYFIAEIDTTNGFLKNCTRGVGFSSADAWQARETLSDNNVLTLMKLTWLFASYNSSTPGFALTYNKPTTAYTAPTGPAIGDYWYDIANSTWKSYDGATWNSTEAVLLGFCIQSSTACVSARSFDFYKSFNALNTMEFERVSTTSVRATKLGQRISVYGTTFPFNVTQPTLTTAADLDSGVSLSASTTYWVYVTDLGNVKISDVRPHERRVDLLGDYHPAKPWRAVSEFVTDAGSLVTNATLVPVDDRGPLVLRDTSSNNFTDSRLLQMISASATGTVRQRMYNLGLTRYFELVSDFTSTTELLRIASDNATIADFLRAGGLRIGNTSGPTLSQVVVGSLANVLKVDLPFTIGGTGAVLANFSSRSLRVYSSDGSTAGAIVTCYPPASHGQFILRGTVTSLGALSVGEGWTSAKNSTGNYTVTFSQAFADVPSVIVTPIPGSANPSWTGVFSVGTGAFSVNTGDNATYTSLKDVAFNFVAIGQRGA